MQVKYGYRSEKNKAVSSVQEMTGIFFAQKEFDEPLACRIEEKEVQYEQGSAEFFEMIRLPINR